MSQEENMAGSLCASWLMSAGEARCDNKYTFSPTAKVAKANNGTKPTDVIQFQHSFQTCETGFRFIVRF